MMTKRLKEILFFPSNNKSKVNTSFYFEEAAQIVNLLPAFFGLTDDDFTASFPNRESKKRLKFIDKEIKFLKKKMEYYDNPRVSNDEFTKKYYFYSELFFSWQDKREPFEIKKYIQEQIKRILKDLEMLYLIKKCSILSEKWNGLETFINPLVFLEVLSKEYLLYKDMVIILNELQERKRNIQLEQKNTPLNEKKETPQDFVVRLQNNGIVDKKELASRVDGEFTGEARLCHHALGKLLSESSETLATATYIDRGRKFRGLK